MSEQPQAPEQDATTQPDQAPQEPQHAGEVDPSLYDVQAKFDAVQEKGHFGERVDPTPLENYTIQGVIAGKPTPETDADAAAKAAQATHTAPNVTARPAVSAASPDEAAQEDANPPSESA